MIEFMESTEMRPIRPRWDGRVMDKGGQSPCLSSMGECRELTEKGTEPSGSRGIQDNEACGGPAERRLEGEISAICHSPLWPLWFNGKNGYTHLH